MKKLALQIMKVLADNGYEVFTIGGSNRSKLHNSLHNDNLAIKDYDIVTNASYDDVAKLFDKVSTRGEQFKVAIVTIDNVEFEIAQYRGESYPEGGSLRPSEVHTVETLKEDVQRRDFTINGIAEDKDGNIVDYVNGVEDIKSKLIRTIGNPNERFAEDPLRILRAVRFKSQLGYQIEANTVTGIIANADRLSIIPHERIAAEIIKILKGKYVKDALNFMHTIAFDFNTFFNSIEKKEVYFLEGVLGPEYEEEIADKVQYINRDGNASDTLLYAALYSKADWKTAEKSMKDSMFMSIDDIQFVTLILKHKELIINQSSDQLLKLIKDLKGKFENRYFLEKILDHIEQIFGSEFHEKEILQRPLFKSELSFNGQDVMTEGLKLGISQKGKWIGDVMDLAQQKSIMNEEYTLESIIKEIVK